MAITKKYDWLLRNARIVDGTGSPWYRGDVGVKGGRIARIGRIPKGEAEQVANVADKILAPGFIDIHTHSDFSMFGDPVMLNKLTQGVTTQMLGQCGMSAAPVDGRTLSMLQAYSGFIRGGVDPDWDWRTFDEWLTHADDLKLAGNVAPAVGHGTIRIAVMGFDNRNATREEMERMKELTREAMRSGCFALTG